ncbi:XdhC family protein [Lacrimispora sp. 210928-DFI.3.58]|uniref:XdhC family protein n=1 Tax=Lacrimispora sp. 210928-DFI.3.58 TaxID=2883214 RepID=UPI0015B66335|nr:XdhC/CoxI family protein [Lacrimispora sp. 210928-DFI.3.58]MCB7317302.1 XdhC family protein [Lacrimispora sp. 210928-DFI.3.58]
MRTLFGELKELLSRGEEAVLVTIIASSGSTPRGAGSRMLVTENGICCGTIGGGAVEYRAMLTAMEALKNKASFTKGFTLTRNQVADIGMVCGGDVVVYIQYVSPENEAFLELCSRVLEALKKDEDSWLLLDITDETCWGMGLYCRSEDRKSILCLGKAGGENSGIPAAKDAGCKADLLSQWEALFDTRAVQKEIGGRKLYAEPLVQAGTVYIFGGGHVAQELVPVLVHVGFRCVVMDDRPEFANRSVFPLAEKTVVGDLSHISDYVSINPWDYVCVMTRGHQFDYYVQNQALALKPAYIGIMGSRSKIKVVTEKLMEDGYAREEIEACHMPIGTQIHAETPAEIAISIAGELISIRAGRLGSRKQRP